MEIIVKPATYECPVCHRIYENKSEAKGCVSGHIKGFNERCPAYKTGSEVMTRNDPNCNYETTKIVAMKGCFLDLRLLVETIEQERYWVPAVRYQTIDFRKDPAPFDFIKLKD
jgi:hypothetical protein